VSDGRGPVRATLWAAGPGRLWDFRPRHEALCGADGHRRRSLRWGWVQSV